MGNSNTLVTVFVDGYMSGNPESIAVRFSHENGALLAPEISTEELGMSFIGSLDVANALLGGDTTFDEHKGNIPPQSLQISQALNSSIALAIRYMQCCTSPEGLRLDPVWCPTIGGRVHIAKITPKVGFRWIPGFDPI